MNKQTFESLYQQLNQQQKQAVETLDGAVMVIAGPGTGKTQVLTLRIANILLKTDVNPENILALTFTESGVAAMRKRLVSIIGEVAFRVNIYTFHSFANYIIQSNPDQFSEILSFESITEIEQVELLQNILEEHSFQHIKPVGDPLFYIRALQTGITELKRENITPKDFAAAIQASLAEFESLDDLYHEKGRYKGKMKGQYQKQLKQIEKNQDLLKAYDLYQKQLKKQHLYDFDDMLLMVIHAMQSDEDFLLQLQEQYQYILIDEHQDTNKAQNKIVQLLASFYENPNVFAVGDAKQAIYRFQGASLTNFLRLRHLYPQAQVINLEENYRSTQLILDASQSLHSNHTSHSELLDTPLKAQFEHNETTINLVDLPNYYAEYHFIAEDISQAISSGTPAEEIAVLARNNADLYEMTRVLAEKKVPFVLESSRNILQEIPVKRFLLLLETIAKIGNDEPLLALLNLNILSVHPVDVFTLRQLAKENQQSLWQTLETLTPKSKQFHNPEKLIHVYKQLLNWHTLSQEQTLDQVFAKILLESGVLKKKDDFSGNNQQLGVFVTLYQQVGLKLQKQPDFSLSQFLEYIQLLNQHGLSLKGQLQIGQKSAVRLMTAHAAKGLEFDRVYILNVYDGKWGNKRGGFVRFELPYHLLGITDTTTVEDKNADDRRLLYVALTRARYQATVSYSQQKLDGSSQVPSQFLTEIGTDFITPQATSSFEDSFSQDVDQIFISSLTKDTHTYEEELTNFIQEQFDTVGLSATALNNYLTCPWRYYFQNIMRLPQEKSLSLIMGNVIHQTIHRYLIHPHTFENSDQIIEEAISQLEKQPLTEVERKDLTHKIKEILPHYYQEKMVAWNKDNQSELWISGVGIGTDIKLRGKIDMLEPLGNSEYRVYDFKTGKPKSRNVIEGNTKNSDGNYKRQLVFYQLLMNRYLGGRMKMVEGVIEFVEPTPAGKLKSESFTISQDEQQQLEETIIRVAKEIRTLDFWDKKCDDPNCEFCTLRQMMDS